MVRERDAIEENNNEQAGVGLGQLGEERAGACDGQREADEEQGHLNDDAVHFLVALLLASQGARVAVGQAGHGIASRLASLVHFNYEQKVKHG